MRRRPETTESTDRGARPPAARAGLVALALVGLLTVVAVSTVARRPLAGRTADRDVSPVFWDYALSTLLALYLVLIPVALYLAWSHGGWRRDPQAGRKRDVGVLVAVAVVLLVLLSARGLRDLRGNDAPTLPTAPTGQATTAAAAGADQPREGELKLAPFLVVGAGLAAAVVLLALRRRGHTPLEGDEEALAEELELLLDETLDDLRAEPDPRKAVIAAYARMERAFAAFGLPRDDPEAPLEYLDRLAPEVDHVPGAARFAFELTHLYERARFSAHEVDAGMKEDAIRALETLRAELEEWAA
jgi:hypothetical protein